MSDTAREQPLAYAPQPRSGPRAWAALFGLLLLCFAVAGLGSLLTTPNLSWYATLEKPFFTPPNAVFGPVWTVLYTMQAFAAWLVWRAPVAAREKRWALALFVVQLALNVAWSWAFFESQNPPAGLAVIAVLLVALVLTGIAFLRIVPLAGLIFVPYGLWVAYAAALNLAIWALNG
jgi:benzodiazapine receptor